MYVIEKTAKHTKPSSNLIRQYLFSFSPHTEVNTDDCIATDRPPNPSENADKDSDKTGEKDEISAKVFVAFVISKNAEIIYDKGTHFTCFFIIPFITLNSETKEIILTELNPALLTEFTKL